MRKVTKKNLELGPNRSRTGDFGINGYGRLQSYTERELGEDLVREDVGVRTSTTELPARVFMEESRKNTIISHVIKLQFVISLAAIALLTNTLSIIFPGGLGNQPK
jgi:hypothetical protein